MNLFPEIAASGLWEDGVGATVSFFPFQFRQNENDFLADGRAELRFQRRGLRLFGSPFFAERFSGRPMLFRKECLEDIGSADSDMQEWSDMDLLLRCRQRGWRVLCLLDKKDAPLHQWQNASSPLGQSLHWPRFFYLAKYFPFELIHFLKRNEKALGAMGPVEADRNLLKMLAKCVDSNETSDLEEVLPLISLELTHALGEKRSNRLWGLLELHQGYRGKIEIGIYDHALQMPGGGQKYACTIAAALQKDYQVTFLTNKPVTTQKLMEWYGLDLSLCRVKIVPLPFFEQEGREFIDQGAVSREPRNPFDLVAAQSKRYDIFINVNMLTKVNPLSGVSIFLCHFPDSKRDRLFYVDEYTYLIANSLYTIEWLQKRWQMRPSVHIYPPVDMAGPTREKEKIILSVARFDQTGSKRQDALIEAFEQMRLANPKALQGWKLILAGGTFGRNPFLQKLKRKIALNSRVGILENIPVGSLKELYSEASIFWHACGLATNIPERIEHFGMATVEAMQNGCVPVTINKGGQKEIVEHGRSGFLFNDSAELQVYTLKLIADEGRLKSFSKNAVQRGLCFSRERFDRSIRLFFDEIKKNHFNFGGMIS